MFFVIDFLENHTKFDPKEGLEKHTPKNIPNLDVWTVSASQNPPKTSPKSSKN